MRFIRVSQLKTKKTYTKKLVGKRIARIMAVQTLYAMNIDDINEDIDAIIYNLIRIDAADNIGYATSKLDEPTLIKLARGTYENITLLKEALQEFLAQNWKFNRLPKLIQAILLVSAYELKCAKNTDQAVIINEYLEIAKLFNHTGEVGFINKVLDKFCDKFLV